VWGRGFVTNVGGGFDCFFQMVTASKKLLFSGCQGFARAAVPSPATGATTGAFGGLVSAFGGAGAGVGAGVDLTGAGAFGLACSSFNTCWLVV